MSIQKESIWELRERYDGIFSHYASECFFYTDSDESQTDLITYTLWRYRPMAIDPRMLNALKVDNSGFATGELTAITDVDSSESNYDREQYEFEFVVNATKKPLIIKLWTGVTLSGEKYAIDGKKSDYNKLTRLLLNLEVITKEQLVEAHRKGEDIPISLDSLIGTKIKFKPLKTAKSKGLSQIDLSTLEVLK
jgi:hypothetical protein